jgi:hypothetical protein
MLSLIDLLNKKVDFPPFQQDKRRSGEVSAFEAFWSAEAINISQSRRAPERK